MARRSWESLSPAYRQRLQRNGISPAQYRAGESLSKARGHAKTPERPARASKNPEKYPEYIEKRSYAKPRPLIRDELEQRVMARKRRLWGAVFKFRDRASDKNVRINPATKRPPTVSDLQHLLSISDSAWDELAASQDKRWAILWYHS